MPQLAPGRANEQIFKFNLNDPAEDKGMCCSDTLEITLRGLTQLPNQNKIRFDLIFKSAGDPGHIAELVGGTLISPTEVVNFSKFGLDVTATSSVPGPIVGAGLPGLILACGILLILARRRQKIA